MDIKNYITVAGYATLREELHNLVAKERPHYVHLVNWAASNGDRSENADYQYGKKKLREIDQRIHQLTKKIEHAEVVDPTSHQGSDKVFFGATVSILRNQEQEQTVTIVGQDEINPETNKISWTSPLAKNLLRKNLGDSFMFTSPQGREEVEIIEISYEY
jgi:transcription elongation factor GreB